MNLYRLLHAWRIILLLIAVAWLLSTLCLWLGRRVTEAGQVLLASNVSPSPTLSPDGKTIVYSSTRTGNGDLYQVNLDGANTRRLTEDPLPEEAPRFSSDGRRIVFLRHHGFQVHVWTMNADGTGQRQLTSGGSVHSNPVPTSDGKQIVFSRSRIGPLADFLEGVYTVSVEGGTPKQLGQPYGFAEVRGFFAGGRKVCVEISSSIGVMDADGSNLKTFSEGAYPAVSADGRRIAFVGGPHTRSLWMMDADGSNRRQICPPSGSKTHPSFMPDGKQIVFLDNQSPSDLMGDLCIVGLDGGALRRIASTR